MVKKERERLEMRWNDIVNEDVGAKGWRREEAHNGGGSGETE